MKGFCPEGEHEVDLAVISTEEEFNVRGESIMLNVSYFRCEDGHTFDDPKSSDDPIDRAYREYRIRQGLLQPEGIRQFRLSTGLTQRELASILGFGAVTLSRYENGALQSEAHDKLLRMAIDPANLTALAKQNQSKLSAKTFSRLLQYLEADVKDQHQSLRALFETTYAQHEQDEYSGDSYFDIEKLTTAILFFCVRSDVFKTKLNKLLFYADFKHFKEFSASISGSRYAHLPFGPVPDHYDLVLAMLHEDERISLQERDYGEYVGEIVRPLGVPDISNFSLAELKTITEVKARFEGCSSSQISKLSHNEKGYKETKDGELISYRFSDALSI